VQHVIRTGDQGATHTYTHGEIHFGNASTTICLPAITAKTLDNTSGLYISAQSADGNTHGDMWFHTADSTSGNAHATTLNKAYVWSNGAAELASITRGGLCTFGVAGDSKVHVVNGNLQVTSRTTESGAHQLAYFSAAGLLTTMSSSRRYKKNIENLTPGLDSVKKMRPVEFDYISVENPTRKMYGLIAEELEEFLPNMVVYNEEGVADSVFYQDLPIILLKAMKEQQAMIETQQAQIAELIEMFNRQ